MVLGEAVAGRHDEAGVGLRLARAASRVRVEVAAAAIDSVLIAGGYCFVMVLRTAGDASATQWAEVLKFLPVAVAMTLVTAWAAGLYAQIWRHASIAEARRVLFAGLASAVLVTGTSIAVGRPFPMSVSVLGSLIVTGLLGAIRFQSRLFALNRQSRQDSRPSGVHVVVMGAGDAAAELVRSMRRDVHCGLTPVVMLDDDPRKVGRLCAGVPVAGTFADLPTVAAQHQLHQAILAVPSASQETVRRAAELADSCDLAMRVLPPVQELIGRRVRTSALRELRIDDLLGRKPVETDLASVRALIEGRRVLITGAGGSIGSEIARQVASCDPGELLLLEHDETHLHETMGSLDGRGTPLLADVRHRDHIARLFLQHRPDVVFHAAAHKHVPLLEAHPCEAVKSNVLGTKNVVDAAVAAGTERFVFISTDKAVRPSSVMGASKRVGELLTLSAGSEHRHYSAVRFGNVLGSRGSVIPTFLRQIETGGPVTITDARMTRFFMSIPEAVQLVLQASAMSEGGEIFMLEMGEPVRILDLAKKMVRLSGYQLGADIEIRVTGIRPGEKLTEELRTPEEAPTPTSHPSIVSLRNPRPIDALEEEEIERLARRAIDGDSDVVRGGLFRLAARSDAHPADSSTLLPAQHGTAVDLRNRLQIDLDEKGSTWTSSTT
jgi:FlaA1/EpsC-like NDP-sugar epimerase